MCLIVERSEAVSDAFRVNRRYKSALFSRRRACTHASRRRRRVLKSFPRISRGLKTLESPFLDTDSAFGSNTLFPRVVTIRDDFDHRGTPSTRRNPDFEISNFGREGLYVFSRTYAKYKLLYDILTVLDSRNEARSHKKIRRIQTSRFWKCARIQGL